VNPFTALPAAAALLAGLFVSFFDLRDPPHINAALTKSTFIVLTFRSKLDAPGDDFI
jgi:hypothetical protein